MKKLMFISSLLGVFILANLALTMMQVNFPENWSQFKALKSGVITSGPLVKVAPGPYTIYGNATAIAHLQKYESALKAGKSAPKFPQGAIFVFVNFQKDGKTPRIVFTKIKDKACEGPTGGWCWEAFKMPSRERIVNNPEKQCSFCHYKSKLSWDGLFFNRNLLK